MRVWVTGRRRPGDRTRGATDDEPARGAIVALGQDGMWLGGGEPTLRPDLPELLRGLSAPGLCTDALPLAQPRVLDTLVEAGLAKVRVRLHAARPDAHDWLVGTPGAAKVALRAIRALRTRGMPVELAATITRPTASLLAELVALAVELRVDAVWLERLDTAAVEEAARIALAPRLGLLDADLGRAATVARATGMPLRIVDVPACAAPHLERWRHEDPWVRPGAAARPARRRCAGCPGGTRCSGVEVAYAERFGDLELRVEAQRAAGGSRAGVPPWVPVEAPGPRGTAAPRAHVATVGAPLGAAGELPSEVTIRLRPDASTRALRQRLVRLSQTGASRLRVVLPTPAHPSVVALLVECTRLAFEEVVVEGDPSPFAHEEDAALFPLRGKVAVLTVVLPGHHTVGRDEVAGPAGPSDAARRGARRFEAMTGATVRVRGAGEQHAFVAARKGDEPVA